MKDKEKSKTDSDSVLHEERCLQKFWIRPKCSQTTVMKKYKYCI